MTTEVYMHARTHSYFVNAQYALLQYYIVKSYCIILTVMICEPCVIANILYSLKNIEMHETFIRYLCKTVYQADL